MYTKSFFALAGSVAAAAAGLAPVTPAVAAPSSADGGHVYAGCREPAAVEERRVAADTPAALAKAIRTARPGDVISLGDGASGAVAIVGDPGDFVTVTSASGARPAISSVSIGGHGPTAHWIIRGLTISGPGDPGVDANGWPTHSVKVRVDNATDIIVEDNQIRTVDGEYPWRPDTRGSGQAVPLANGVVVTNSTCVAVVGNHIHNVFNGVGLDGDQIDRRGTAYLVEDNDIDAFAGDGIDESGSHVLIRHNLITNGHDTCQDICIHNDGIQGWTHLNDPRITNTDVTIDGNTILLRTTPDPAMQADDLHGITIFDGHWKGVTVVNNVIATNAWHGITLFGVTDGLIANNTVVGVDPTRKTWIDVSPAKANSGGANSDRVIVRNNIAPAVKIDRRGQGPAQLTVDHNLVDADPRRLFVAFDPKAAVFDLHLRPGSEAQGRGAADKAPPMDADGHARSAHVDLGAYVAGS
jgi:hypothetical protein